MQVFKLAATSELIIQSSGLQLEKGNLLSTYDTRGYKYTIPASVINDPDAYSSIQSANSEIPPLLEANIKDFNVTIRAMAASDTLITIKNSMKVEAMIEIYKDKLAAAKIMATQIRLFYSGKELLCNSPLYIYPAIDGKIIQAMVVVQANIK